MATLTQCLPADRFIRSTIEIDDRSPAAFSFGTIMILTDESNAGPGATASPVDADDRVRSYTTIDDVAAEWATNSLAYLAAQAAFSQSPGPDLIKIGFVTAYTAAELQAVEDCDPAWYGLATASLRDDAAIMEVAAWVEPRTKVYVNTSNDTNTKDRTNLTNIAEGLKQAGYDRTMTIFHDDPLLFPDAAFLAEVLANDFNQPSTAYTGKFSSLAGISGVALTNTEIQAVTGYVPHQGLDANQGHFANTIACHCDRNLFVEGNMASGRFFDSIHATDFIKVRIEEELCTLLARTHVPYTQAGIQTIADIVTGILRGAQLAGIVAPSESFEGNFLPGFEVTVPNVINATSAQRANRIAPTIQYDARLSGAYHSVAASGTATIFVN